jgi:hypothetical protein
MLEITERKNEWGFVFFIASGVGLSPLYCGHFWPIVPAPDDRRGWLWRLEQLVEWRLVIRKIKTKCCSHLGTLYGYFYRGVPVSGMLRHVVWYKFTDISEERDVSIFRVEEASILLAAWFLLIVCLAYSSTPTAVRTQNPTHSLLLHSWTVT